MNFLSQLLPGFRSVRAPLLGGYLWLVLAWFLFRGDLPQPHEAAIYKRASELGDLIGPAGLAVAVSVAAYLIGSLVQLLLTSLTDLFAIVKRNRIRRSWTDSLGNAICVSDLGKNPLFRPADIFWLDGDRTTKERLKELVEGETATGRATVNSSVEAATKAIREHAGEAGDGGNGGLVIALRPEVEHGVEPKVQTFVVRDGEREAPNQVASRPDLPTFSAALDLFEERKVIKTRLMETTDQAGSEVERLYSEAELRVAVALPLFAILLVLLIQSQDWPWAPMLLVPVGLLLHAVSLNKHGGREMVEALRSRSDEAELLEITPVFQEYTAKAASLSAAIKAENWAALANRMPAPPVDSPT